MNNIPYEIPINAFQPKSDTIKYPNTGRWWCPDCGASGEGEADKYVRYNNGMDRINGGRRVNYCCEEQYLNEYNKLKNHENY